MVAQRPEKVWGKKVAQVSTLPKVAFDWGRSVDTSTIRRCLQGVYKVSTHVYVVERVSHFDQCPTPCAKGALSDDVQDLRTLNS